MTQWRATGSQYNGLGYWLYGNDIVVATNDSVTAYDRADGTVLWKTAPPGNGQDFCGASTTSSQDTVSLGYGAQGDNQDSIACEYVTVLHLDTGRLGWSAHLPTANELQQMMHANGIVTEVAGRTVVVGWTGVVAGYDLATGRQLYRNLIYPNGDYTPFSVKDIAIQGSTDYVLAHTDVPLSAGMTPVTVFESAVATGQEIGKDSVNGADFGFTDPDAAAFVSTSPLVAVIGDFQTTDNRYAAFDGRLRITSSIDGGRELDANSNSVPGSLDTGLFYLGIDQDAHQPYRTLVANGSLFSVTNPRIGNQVVAVDLAGGKQRWAVDVPGLRMMMPVAVDGSSLVVAAVGKADDAPVTLLRLDVSTGKVVSQHHGSVPIGAVSAGQFWFTWADHRAYAVNWGSAHDTIDPAVFAVG